MEEAFLLESSTFETMTTISWDAHPQHSGQGVIKKKNFCLRILIYWAQIDPWGLIRRTNTIKSVSETFLLIEILV